MMAVPFLVFPLVALGGLALVSWCMRRWRSRRLAAVAERLGLDFRTERIAGSAKLPSGMELQGTMFQRVSSKWNVMHGRVRGVEVMVFDCTVGRGKTPWRMTVYGVRGRQFADGEVGAKAGEWYVRSEGRVWFARLDREAEVEAMLERL